jgi:hypothetical protein
VSDTDGPLSVLRKRLLLLGPPSLSALIGRLGDVEEYDNFCRLVREFLPEREGDILSQLTPDAQIGAFASHFEDRYFPLPPYLKEGDCEGYSQLTQAIPMIVYGVSYEDYHYMATDSRLGYILMTYLVEAPYGEENSRITFAEAAKEHVPIALLERVPERGFSSDECRQLLKDTKYEGLSYWAGTLQHDTGNAFLDIDEEDLYSGMQLPYWDRETVDELTRQWQLAEVMNQKISDLSDWLEEDPPARFEELLNFMLEGRENDATKEPNELPVGVAGEH